MADKSPSQRLVEVSTGRDLTELLQELYVQKRWTDQEIADHLNCGVTRSTIRTWRAQLGIERAARKIAVA